MPCERDDATIERVQVLLPSSFRRESGDPMWTGDEADAVAVVLHVTPREAGDFAIPVLQTYSDGRIVRWSGTESSSAPAPVVHVAAAENANRDRLVIVLLAAALAVAFFALRHGRQRR